MLEYQLGGKRHQRGARDVGDRGRGVLRRRQGAARRPRTRSSTGSPTSGSATSASASRSRRCPAASGSGSSWPPRWPRRAASTSSTSRRRGLHLADVEQLLGLLDRLVDSGKSVIVIEHHQAVMAHADWIIDLGPGAGHDGGRIVFEGTPADLVAARSTLTGEHLAAYVGPWSTPSKPSGVSVRAGSIAGPPSATGLRARPIRS